MKIKTGNSTFIKLSFDNFKWFKYNNDNANKFICNYHEVSVQLGWLKISYINDNYNKIIHCILDEDENYGRAQQHLVNVLLASLKLWITKDTTMFPFESDYIRTSLPFSFKYIIKENKHLICYITGPKDWFTKHNLGAMSQLRLYPDCYMTSEEIDYYFPKWKKKSHNFKHIYSKNFN